MNTTRVPYIDRRSWHSLPALRILALTALLLAGAATTLNAQGDSLATLEALVAEWSRLRVAIADEQRSWDEQERQWHAEIVLLNKEIEALQEEIGKATSAQESIEADRLKALRDQERLSQMLDGLPVLLERAESALRAWPDQFPPPLRESLESLFLRLMQDSGESKPLGDAARLQRVVALYTEIEKLQHDIHVVKEILTMPDGSRKEVDVCYLGLARAFAVSADNAWSGVGVPTGQGWHWETRKDIADRVRLAISIYNREKIATLVDLPLAVREVKE